MNGPITEREWRRQRAKQGKRPDWYGPQYVMPTRRPCALLSDRSFHLFVLLLGMTVAALLPVFCPSQPNEVFEQAFAVEEYLYTKPRQVSDICYEARCHGEWIEKTYTEYELSRGKMLLLDDAHPLPEDLPPPNTYRIASYGKGMIPVDQLSLKSGRETMDALAELFAALRLKGAGSLTVCGATVSEAEQREMLLRALRGHMRQMPIEEARQTAMASADWPGTGEMLREYTIDLRFRDDTQSGTASEILLHTAWRYGFVQINSARRAEHTFRFRYVGKAHATAMTYLALDLEDYLHWLHHKRELTILENGKPKYLILCKEMEGTRVPFRLPAGAAYDVSIDNMGYAVAACTLP